MPQLIASTYEMREKLGAGGIGTVYRGWHTRLDKEVVLKAEQRTLKTGLEELRREVNMLKNLSHTYIPQVYDFITEADMVYTVMDYIKGESLDTLLQNESWSPSQTEVIGWACQLLEALRYLHSQPPYGILHGDIKPANIMLTPQGDIRLIDFNIALALGEEGAIQVGHSRGYASPEHYGIDYSVRRRHTVRLVDGARSTTSDAAQLLLDVRSDIYCLGATLYHLLTGKPPAEDAKDVTPIHSQAVSPAVAAIIQKAMAPDPDQRYQTAQEMLDAFEHLHENDPRTKRHKRQIQITAAVLTLLFLVGGLCSFTGLRQMQQSEAAARLAEEEARLAAEAAEAEERAAKEAEEAARTALAAVGDAESALREGDIPTAVAKALEALSIESPYAAHAQRVLTEALGVYDLTDGFKAYQLLELPSEPVKVALSPDGTWTAAIASGSLSVFDTTTGELLVKLETEPTALSDVVFPGENMVLYAGKDALRAYDLVQQKELWSGDAATGIALSANGSIVAAVYKDETYAMVYDVFTGSIVQKVDFYGLHQAVTANDLFVDPGDNLFVLSDDGRWLGVSFDNGALWIFDLLDSENDVEIYDSSNYTRFEGGFCGNQFAFVSTSSSGSESAFAVIDLDSFEVLDFFEGTVPFHTQVDENGIYFAAKNTLVKLNPETQEETEIAYTETDITKFQIGDTYTAVLTRDGVLSFFDRAAKLLETHTWESSCDFVASAGKYVVTASWNVPSLRVLALENHEDSQIFSYDIAYPHDEARLSSDGKTVMLFRYDKFRLYGINSGILADVDIPDAEQVYDQQYRRGDNGSYLEVTYNDGLIRNYSAVDGRILSEIHGEKPDGTLHDIFLTNHWRIEAPLHGTPIVYDRETGELVAELEPGAYLTYVTQVGEYVITEYVSTQGERYGLLLNEDCQPLADLPNLCDVLEDGTLVFDDMMGNLRRSRIYSLQELCTLAES